MTTPAARVRAPDWLGSDLARRWALPVAVIALIVSYPLWAIEDPFRALFVDKLGMDMDTVFQMAVYVMLALGLNIVVG